MRPGPGGTAPGDCHMCSPAVGSPVRTKSHPECDMQRNERLEVVVGDRRARLPQLLPGSSRGASEGSEQPREPTIQPEEPRSRHVRCPPQTPMPRSRHLFPPALR